MHRDVPQAPDLSALVVIGGDRDADHRIRFSSADSDVGVPKTIDNDRRRDHQLFRFRTGL